MKRLFIFILYFLTLQESFSQILNSSNLYYDCSENDFIQKLEKWVAINKNEELNIDYINKDKGELIISGTYNPLKSGLYATSFDILKPYITYSIEFTCKENECNYSFKNTTYYFKSSYGDVSYIPKKYLDETEIELNEIIANDAKYVIDESFKYSIEYDQEKMNSYKKIADDVNQKKNIRKKNLEMYNKYVIENKVYKKIISDLKIMQSTIYLQLSRL